MTKARGVFAAFGLVAVGVWGVGCGASKISGSNDAGVDMTTDEPLELTIKKMNRVMDEMEKLIK